MSRYSLLLLVASFLPVASTLAYEDQHICRFCASGHCRADDDDRPPKPSSRKYAPTRQVDLLHLKLEVTPDFDRRTVAGTATLEFSPIAKPLEELQLDAIDLDVSAVRASVEVSDYTVTREHLTITFAEPISAGERVRLEVDYSAEPREGLYFRTAEMGYPAEDTHLFTQGEPQLGRYWFPSHDYPNERCTTEIICHVPREMTVLSNGQLVGETASGGMKAVHWRQEKPHVCYLITLVAGYFSKLEDLDRDVPLAFYAQPTDAEHAANSFSDTAAIIDFFNQEIGVPFPWHKYFQVTVRDFQFGGMENTSMTTLANRTLTATTVLEVRAGRIRKLDAHETAHQWFGNLVTCKDWSHLWLNESFATYYSHLYEGHKFGRDAQLYDLYYDATERVLPYSRKDRRPIVYNRYDDPLEQFDFRAYPKGSWVLHMLRTQLGEELFRECIRTYLDRHAFTSVTTPDLVKVCEELSGRSLDRFFDQWIYHGGVPELKISYKWLAKKKLARVTVEQTQNVDDQVLLFEFPTVLRFRTEGQTVDHPVRITKEKQDIFVPLAKQPIVVRFDPEYTVLADVEFEKSEKLLRAQLAERDDVIGRVLAVHALADLETQDALAAVGKALRDDPFFGVRIEAAKALGDVNLKASLAELQTALDADDGRVRLAVVEAISKHYSSPAEELLLQVVAKARNPAIIAEATRGLGKYRSSRALSIVEQQLSSDSFRNEQAVAAMEAIGKQQHAGARDALVRTLANRGAEFNSVGIGTGLKELASISRELTDPESRGLVEQFVRGYVEHPNRQVKIAAVEALGELGDARSQAVLEALTTDEPRDAVAKAAERALKRLQSDAPKAPEELTELRDLVTELADETRKLRTEVDELKAEETAVE